MFEGLFGVNKLHFALFLCFGVLCIFHLSVGPLVNCKLFFVLANGYCLCTR